MNRTKTRTTIVALFMVASTSVYASDFLDTRLTWTYGDDDVLHNSGEVVPDSPKAGIGDRSGYNLFMDNLNTKTSGRENLTHIALYKKMPGFFKGLTTEAGVVLKIDFGALQEADNPSVRDVLMDDGSFLRAQWSWDKENEKENYFGITFFPFDTERFRLGYLWDISWGGGNIFSTNRSGPAPGFRAEASARLHKDLTGYVFAGMKTARVKQVVQLGTGEVEEITVNETNYGTLGGFGVDAINMLAIDFGAGYFEQGTFPFEGLIGTKVYSAGLSSRLTFHKGLPIQTSVDYMLYRNDPSMNFIEWWHEKYVPGQVSYSVSVEGSYLWQRLSDSRQFGTTKMQGAYAAALQAKLKWGFFRGQFVGLIRNLEFILQNVPSLTPFVAVPEKNVKKTPELFFAGTFDYYFDRVHLMPFITFGVQLPASFSALDDKGNVVSVQVIRNQTRRDRLPAGFTVDASDWHSWIYAVRVGLQWDVSDFMSFLGMVQYVRDENMTRLEIEPTGERRVFQSPHKLGFNIVARARF